MKNYHKNPRQITKKQYSQLEEWLRELGDLSGIVHDLNSDEIIGGNQRGRVFDINKCKVEIIQQLDNPDEQGTVAQGFIIWEGKRYSYRQVRWDEKQCEKANIIANKAGGSWDFDCLANSFEVTDLIEWGFEPFELGIVQDEPQGEDPGAQVDKAEELREKWGVELGQLWKLGEHRLICGDCTDRAVVERVMENDRADLVFTSPPYGQQRDYRDGATEKLSDWDALMNGAFTNIFGNDNIQILVNLGMIHNDGEWQPYYDAWIEWMRSCGWKRFGLYVWDQGFGLMGDWGGRLAPSHEFIFHFNKSAKQPNKIIEKKQESIKIKRGEGLRKKDGSIGKLSNPLASLQTHKIPDSVIRVFRSSEPIREFHPAVFSLSFAEFNIEVWANQNDIVYEPFSGSGTTLIACERLSRKCRAVEISPAYCAVALQRWADMTGQTPELIDRLTL